MNSIGPSASEKVNILLVDDQPAKLLSYEVILGELNESLIKANSANEALQHLLKNEIAVVLIDVCMPDLDGFELAGMIREHPRFQRTAIIFVSAIMMSDLDRLRGYELGAVDYVPVPFTPELLRAKVRVFADLYRKTRQLELLNSELERRVEQRTAELARANTELERRVEERTREREEALAQVHEMQKMESLGQLTGGVAHDFNNLLMVILGNLQLLRKRVPDEPRLARLIDGAIKGAERGATLTKRMLAFARRQELKPETVEVIRLIGGMEEMLRRTLGTTIQINIELQDDLPAIRVDPNQLELALLNLTLNACDAMPLGGRLEIAARRMPAKGGPQGLVPGDYVCLAVSDSGTGMDEATVKRATEPFFTTKGAGKGTGLGLSMVHGLAAQSGGAMRIFSNVGAGTSVELWLPTTERAMTEPVGTLTVRSGAARCYRILVVDDDPLIGSATTAMLEDLGHVVIETTSGTRALEALRSTPMIDLVITDQAMPGMTGTQLSRLIRQSWPELPIILATGYADLPNGEDPGLPRLSKPYQQEELSAMITQVLGPVRDEVDNVIPLDAARRA
ncbi:MAG TPA: response regulator [Acetobacteraceae bacterium]|nr:response regulator [Acetobacteraceae bacterium]